MTNIDLQQEMIKSLFSIAVSVITLGLGWVVGQRLTVYWGIRQKQRELELSAMSEFYRLYGEFFSVWKLWAYCRKQPNELIAPEMTRWELLERATNAEGMLEAIFVKLSSERALSDFDIETLGRFRQAYQKLRESIRSNEGLGWPTQDNHEYTSFKRLAYIIACMIRSDKSKIQNGDALIRITAGTWDNKWTLSEEDWENLNIHNK